MPKITYVEADGRVHVVEVPAGATLMAGAVRHDVPGILADCGGSCACGTCRVYLDESWFHKLGGPSDIESATMDGYDDPMPGKRLSCQIVVQPDFDGMVVHLPESQF